MRREQAVDTVLCSIFGHLGRTKLAAIILRHVTLCFRHETNTRSVWAPRWSEGYSKWLADVRTGLFWPVRLFSQPFLFSPPSPKLHPPLDQPMKRGLLPFWFANRVRERGILGCVCLPEVGWVEWERTEQGRLLVGTAAPRQLAQPLDPTSQPRWRDRGGSAQRKCKGRSAEGKRTHGQEVEKKAVSGMPQTCSGRVIGISL